MTLMSRKVLIVLLIIVCAPLLAADFWEKKVFSDWSEKECVKLLTKSSWGYKNSFRSAPNIGSLSWDNTVEEIFNFSLVSAKPVRMALAQLQLLQRPNDEALKSQIQGYVATTNEKHILIQLSCRTVPAGAGDIHEINGFFGRANTTMFQSNTVLASGDEVFVPLLEYLPSSPTRSNPIFVFSRLNNAGEPFFTGKEKSISFSCEFRMQTISSRDRKVKFFFKMKPKDMWFDGNFEL